MKDKRKLRRNKARIMGCRLHEFNWKEDMRRAIERKRAREEEAGVFVGISVPVFCRCKNCGGKAPLLYAAGYMEAITHMNEVQQCHSGEETE